MFLHPIGIFDSGYGGLTIARSIVQRMPQYDYLYIGDNARAPYGNRSFETIHEYTWECVQWAFAQGCPLVILACNTASAKALRTIQQHDLPNGNASKRVLGVIRPTAEVIGTYSKTGAVGIMGTSGTVNSRSYLLETEKFFPGLKVYQQECPMLVPLIESGEWDQPGTDYFIKKYTDALMAQSNDIDTVLLACTHYPLLEDKIRSHLPEGVNIVTQGEITAASLQDYLTRHTAMEQRLSRHGLRQFFTTDDASGFEQHAAAFFGEPVKAKTVHL